MDGPHPHLECRDVNISVTKCFFLNSVYCHDTIFIYNYITYILTLHIHIYIQYILVAAASE